MIGAAACLCCELARGGSGGVGICSTCRDYFDEESAVRVDEIDPQRSMKLRQEIIDGHEWFHQAGGDQNPAAVKAVQPEPPVGRHKPPRRLQRLAGQHPEIAWLVGLLPPERAFHGSELHRRLLREFFPNVSEDAWQQIFAQT